MSFTPINITTHSPSDLGDLLTENHRAARFINHVDKAADFTVGADDTDGTPVDWFNCDATSAAVTGTLPAVADADVGRIYYARKTDGGANAVGLDADGSETINGSASTYSTTTQHETVAAWCDGSEWFGFKLTV